MKKEKKGVSEAKNEGNKFFFLKINGQEMNEFPFFKGKVMKEHAFKNVIFQD